MYFYLRCFVSLFSFKIKALFLHNVWDLVRCIMFVACVTDV